MHRLLGRNGLCAVVLGVLFLSSGLAYAQTGLNDMGEVPDIPDAVEVKAPDKATVSDKGDTKTQDTCPCDGMSGMTLTSCLQKNPQCYDCPTRTINMAGGKSVTCSAPFDAAGKQIQKFGKQCRQTQGSCEDLTIDPKEETEKYWKEQIGKIEDIQKSVWETGQNILTNAIGDWVSDSWFGDSDGFWGGVGNSFSGGNDYGTDIWNNQPINYTPGPSPAPSLDVAYNTNPFLNPDFDQFQRQFGVGQYPVQFDAPPGLSDGPVTPGVSIEGYTQEQTVQELLRFSPDGVKADYNDNLINSTFEEPTQTQEEVFAEQSPSTGSVCESAGYFSTACVSSVASRASCELIGVGCSAEAQMYNNNPGNWVKGNEKWLAENGIEVRPCGGRFLCFNSVQDGAKADALQTTDWIKGELRRGFIDPNTGELAVLKVEPRDTLSKLMNTLSPPHENNTAGMIHHMSKALGIGPHEKIDYSNPYLMARLFEEKTRLETGRSLSGMVGGMDNLAQLYASATGIRGFEPVQVASTGVNVTTNQYASPFDLRSAEIPASAPVQFYTPDNSEAIFAEPAIQPEQPWYARVGETVQNWWNGTPPNVQDPQFSLSDTGFVGTQDVSVQPELTTDQAFANRIAQINPVQPIYNEDFGTQVWQEVPEDQWTLSDTGVVQTAQVEPQNTQTTDTGDNNSGEDLNNRVMVNGGEVDPVRNNALADLKARADALRASAVQAQNAFQQFAAGNISSAQLVQQVQQLQNQQARFETSFNSVQSAGVLSESELAAINASRASVQNVAQNLQTYQGAIQSATAPDFMIRAALNSPENQPKVQAVLSGAMNSVNTLGASIPAPQQQSAPVAFYTPSSDQEIFNEPAPQAPWYSRAANAVSDWWNGGSSANATEQIALSDTGVVSTQPQEQVPELTTEQAFQQQLNRIRPDQPVFNEEITPVQANVPTLPQIPNTPRLDEETSSQIFSRAYDRALQDELVARDALRSIDPNNAAQRYYFDPASGATRDLYAEAQQAYETALARTNDIQINGIESQYVKPAIVAVVEGEGVVSQFTGEISQGLRTLSNAFFPKSSELVVMNPDTYVDEVASVGPEGQSALTPGNIRVNYENAWQVLASLTGVGPTVALVADQTAKVVDAVQVGVHLSEIPYISNPDADTVIRCVSGCGTERALKVADGVMAAADLTVVGGIFGKGGKLITEGIERTIISGARSPVDNVASGFRQRVDLDFAYNPQTGRFELSQISPTPNQVIAAGERGTGLVDNTGGVAQQTSRDFRLGGNSLDNALDSLPTGQQEVARAAQRTADGLTPTPTPTPRAIETPNPAGSIETPAPVQRGTNAVTQNPPNNVVPLNTALRQNNIPAPIRDADGILQAPARGFETPSSNPLANLVDRFTGWLYGTGDNTVAPVVSRVDSTVNSAPVSTIINNAPVGQTGPVQVSGSSAIGTPPPVLQTNAQLARNVVNTPPPAAANQNILGSNRIGNAFDEVPAPIRDTNPVVIENPGNGQPLRIVQNADELTPASNIPVTQNAVERSLDDIADLPEPWQLGSRSESTFDIPRFQGDEIAVAQNPSNALAQASDIVALRQSVNPRQLGEVVQPPINVSRAHELQLSAVPPENGVPVVLKYNTDDMRIIANSDDLTKLGGLDELGKLRNTDGNFRVLVSPEDARLMANESTFPRRVNVFPLPPEPSPSSLLARVRGAILGEGTPQIGGLTNAIRNTISGAVTLGGFSLGAWLAGPDSQVQAPPRSIDDTLNSYYEATPFTEKSPAGQVFTQDTYCVTNLSPLTMIPVKAGTPFPANCYNDPVNGPKTPPPPSGPGNTGPGATDTPTPSPTGGAGNLGALGQMLGPLLQRLMGQDQNQQQGTANPPVVKGTGSLATLTANPANVTVGGTAQLTWSSIGTTACVVTSSGTTTAQIAQGGRDGSVTTPALSETTQFTVSCTTPEPTNATAQATVQVVPAAPGVLFLAKPAALVSGSKTKLSWSTVGTNSCKVSKTEGGEVLAEGGKSGSTEDIVLTATTQFKLECTPESSGGAAKSALITVLVGSI